MRKFAVIVAAGAGTRMGNSLPKQFLELLGRPVFMHSVEAFLRADPDFTIILVVHQDFLEKTKQAVAAGAAGSRTTVIPGGTTRTDSVKAGLALVDSDSIVFIHDAARCAVSPRLIRDCYTQALELGSAIPVVPVTDSVRRLTEGGSEPLSRDDLRLVQTPQTFRAGLIKNAYQASAGTTFTDDASVLENAGVPVHLIDGEITNIKITRPTDLKIAAELLKILNA